MRAQSYPAASAPWLRCQASCQALPQVLGFQVVPYRCSELIGVHSNAGVADDTALRFRKIQRTHACGLHIKPPCDLVRSLCDMSERVARSKAVCLVKIGRMRLCSLIALNPKPQTPRIPEKQQASVCRHAGGGGASGGWQGRLLHVHQ